MRQWLESKNITKFSSLFRVSAIVEGITEQNEITKNGGNKQINNWKIKGEWASGKEKRGKKISVIDSWSSCLLGLFPFHLLSHGRHFKEERNCNAWSLDKMTGCQPSCIFLKYAAVESEEKLCSFDCVSFYMLPLPPPLSLFLLMIKLQSQVFVSQPRVNFREC